MRLVSVGRAVAETFPLAVEDRERSQVLMIVERVFRVSLKA